MALTMQCDLERDDIAGCARKISPVLFSLLAAYLGKVGVDVTRFTDGDYKKIDKERMLSAYPDFQARVWPKLQKFSSGARLTHINMLLMLKETDYDGGVMDQLYALRDIETDIRNEIAHLPLKLTKEEFMERTGGTPQENAETDEKPGKTPQEMLEDVHRLFETMDPALFTPSFWQSYQEMQEFLLEKLRRF